MGTRHWPEDADDAVEKLQNRIDKLQQENAELRAYCETLRVCCHMLDCGMVVSLDKIEQVPQQSLADIQADAIDDAYDIAKGWIEKGESVSDIEMTPHNISMMLAGLGQICITANQLRVQANEGKPVI